MKPLRVKMGYLRNAKVGTFIIIYDVDGLRLQSEEAEVMHSSLFISALVFTFVQAR